MALRSLWRFGVTQVREDAAEFRCGWCEPYQIRYDCLRHVASVVEPALTPRRAEPLPGASRLECGTAVGTRNSHEWLV